MNPFILYQSIHFLIMNHRLRHTKQTAIDTLTLRRELKRLETITLEYVPLSQQGIVEEIVECKEELKALRRKEKQREKKQDLMKRKRSATKAKSE